jgi:hypothetical protein
MAENEGPVVFGGKELDPDQEAKYRSQIAEARKGGVSSLKGGDPVGIAPKVAIPVGQRPVTRAPGEGVTPRPPGSPLLSPETAQQLQDLAAAQVAQAATAKVEEKKAEEKKVEESLFDAFDFDGRNEAEKVLNNKKRRKEIEDRCEPMKLEDLIMRDEVQQVVQIVPGKFDVTYRSMTPDDNLYIKRYISKHDTGQSDQYVLEKFGMCQLTCTVVSINGRALPEYRKADGDVDDELFEKKLKMLLKKSAYVVADLGINYSWFDIRVRKLLNPDSLGNG